MNDISSFYGHRLSRIVALLLKSPVMTLKLTSFFWYQKKRIGVKLRPFDYFVHGLVG